LIARPRKMAAWKYCGVPIILGRVTYGSFGTQTGIDPTRIKGAGVAV
jgi:hypothetical protein